MPGIGIPESTKSPSQTPAVFLSTLPSFPACDKYSAPPLVTVFTA